MRTMAGTDDEQHGNADGRFSNREVQCWTELVDLAPLSPLAGCSLSAKDVHIRRSWLDQPPWRVRQLAQTLSADERERADRFRFETDRMRFIVGRGTLRSILGRYLNTEPGRVQLCYGPHGKPHLREESNQATIRFNLAHSHQLAIYAFARTREVGIDLEYIRPVPRLQQIAASVFSARENALLSGLPASQQQEAFYLCWTCKEAYVKAKGLGLEHPLEQFDVSLVPGEPARLLRVESDPGDTSRWSLRWLEPAPGYVAALAVEGHDWRPAYYDLR
ncbi:MAG TPA: 4'-phosphopantetheinyl transferase superfamily protein [Anaerolineae bacterium]|nr:4'-phosphopantetheinyl transferase superfamily protein [Anaerolineae bacterium]